MDSSSENSFAWTDTLSDSSRNSIKSTSMAADDINDFSNENFSKNDEKKTKKDKLKKKHRDLSASLDPNFKVKEEKSYYENTITSSGKKKHIKIEADMCKKKKNNKILETDEEQESMSYDETYLNMKVKQEHSSAACSTKEKKKKLKQSSSVDSSTTAIKINENGNYSTDVFENNFILKEETDDTKKSNNKKKKKMLKTRHSSDNQNLDIEEKMDIEESIENHTEDTFVSNKTLNKTQEGSEESGCDEISAIKCDDSHSPHTISFINKNIDEENIQVNYNNSLNISTKLASGSVPEYDSNKKLEVAKIRKQRISDRLRFEDDEDEINMSGHSEHDSYSENNKSLKLQKFIKTHPNLKLLPPTVNDNAYLTRDDEICIVRCPKELHIKDFENTAMNIQGKCKIKVAGQTYELSFEEQSDTTSLLTIEQNIYKIRNMPLNGIIHLRKRIPKAHFRDDNIMVNNQTNFIPLPETKCRHPLFGSNYKKALKIPAAIAERLNVLDSEDSLVQIATSKKTKDKNKNTLESVNPHAQSDITTKIERELPVEVREKKKSYKCQICPSTFKHKSDLKSHKSAHTHENWSDINIKTEPEHPVEVREKKKKKRKMIDDELSAPKKVKRMKHDPDSAEAWESEKAIEENLFNF